MTHLPRKRAQVVIKDRIEDKEPQPLEPTPEQIADDMLATMVVNAIATRMDRLEEIRTERARLQQEERDAVMNARRLGV